MTRLLSSTALVLCLATTASASDKKANPADFPLTIQVLTSGFVEKHPGSEAVLEVVINGKPFQLRTPGSLFPLGNYPARGPKRYPSNPKPGKGYDFSMSYDLLMPDGSVRRFEVTRLGPAVPVYPPSN